MMPTLKRTAQVSALLLALTPFIATAAEPALANDLKTNPYYELYATRVEMAKANVDKQNAQLAYFTSREEMYKRLYAQNAASRDEYMESVSLHNLSVAELEEDTIRVLEANALLNITVARVSNGLEMPICTVQQNTSPIKSVLRVSELLIGRNPN
jgi:hypothetical protein